MQVKDIAKKFQIAGNPVDIAPWGNGHIHDTYLVVCQSARYILQRINSSVFHNPLALMENIRLVLAHIEKKSADCLQEFRALTIIPVRDGQSCYRDTEGHFWRVYVFVEGHARDRVENPEDARQIAKAFGRFQTMLVDFPGRLHETIPGFHDMEKRLAALQESVKKDACRRALTAKREIDFALRHCDICSVLADLRRQGAVPLRITHNDTKANNVILDDSTGKSLCVIDLDTVMPGLTLYDFGDMVRSIAATADEDERDLSRVKIDLSLFKALANGYLETAVFLNDMEKYYLAFSGKSITFETGIRFLTDYLDGDVYFKTNRPGHNLDRCRNQFRLVEEISRVEDEMTHIAIEFTNNFLR